jgi:hypothetical protein
MKKLNHEMSVSSAALLALVFLFVMTATEGPYWGNASIEDSIIMIPEEEEQTNIEGEALTGMTIVRKQIHGLYKKGVKTPVTVCEGTEYVISDGEKIPKAETCEVWYVEASEEQLKETYKNI